MSNKNNDKQNLKAMNSRLQQTPIAIVGMASVFADAKNLNEYWDNIVEKVNSIIDIPPSRWSIDDYYSADKSQADKTYCKRGAFIPEIDFDPMEFGLPPNILEVTDIAQLLALVVAKDVINDAGIGDESGYDRDKVGVVLGVGGGLKQIVPLTSRLQYPVLNRVLDSCGVAEQDREKIIEKFQKAYIPWEENSFPGMLGNVIAGRIANRFDLGGTNCVVDAACAGSLAAMRMAVADLLDYRSEMMITGGICCDNSPFMYMSFSKTPAFTTGEDIRPFDEESKGMMVGEGIGMVMMKRLEDAERDGDKIYAVLTGVGTSSDGRFKSIYAPRPDGQAKALQRAYDDAGFDPATVGLIEAHGTGTMAGDAAEFGGLSKFFAGADAENQTIALGSVKSQIGHTKSAAGAAGFIKACLALHHKVLPATINVDNPSPALKVEESPFYINSETRPWMPRKDGEPRRAGVSSFGFGGTNFHFVLEEYKPEQQGAYRLNPVPQGFLFAAKTPQDLPAVLNDALSSLNVDADEQVFAFRRLAKQFPVKTCSDKKARLGFVAQDANDAISLLQASIKQLQAKPNDEKWSLPTGVYYRSKGFAACGSTVALFSGQGSQYVNMGVDLACNFPPVLSTFAAMDKAFVDNGLAQLSRTVFPIPAFTAEAKKQQEANLQLTQFAQPAIGTFSMAAFELFKQAGLKADFAAGHSFGELTALWAAEVLNDDDYRQLALARGQAMAAPEDENFDAGTMVAVVADSDTVAAAIKDMAGVSIANYNSNNQVVIAGATEAVNKAFDELKAQGLRVVKLPVSAAFHTPLVGHAQKPFAAAIEKAKFKKPSIPVFSNGSGKVHSDKPAEIKKALKNHILESVRFKEEIDNLYAAGGRVFIEFGPKNVLTKLVENILADKEDVITIAVNANPKRSSDLQLRQAAVQMVVNGVLLKEVDSFAAEQPLEAAKKSPMTMKLSAASYVSDKTKKAFEDALNDGYTISQAEPQVIEKIVEVEKVVEKVVQVPVATGGQAASAPAPQAHSNDLALLLEQQRQLLAVHEQFMQGSQDYNHTVQQALAKSTGDLTASVSQLLAQYHAFQTDTLRVHEQFLNLQTQYAAPNTVISSTPVTATSYVAPAPVAAQPAIAAPVVTPATPVVTSTPTPAVAPVAAPVAQPAAAPQQVTSQVVAAPAVAASAAIDTAKIQQVMLEVVADKTGYPVDMLELEMDMEADLGIDSIKRVEILGAVQEQIADLPELNPEDLAELRTLGQIVDYMQSKAGASAPVAQAAAPVAATTSSGAAIDTAKIQQVMLNVVADKTGYPVDMLELEMDMEADLGIDSIKRVEILGAVQEQIPNLPELNPEDLAELRTLGQIVDYMQSKAGASAPATQAAAPVAAVASSGAAIDTAKIQQVMLNVVADKTGYPVDMLELSMGMEADLGIDSIKRVEILGAVQEQIPNLPELNPEDLAELRTLGQIVDYMQSKAGAASAPIAQAAVAQTATAVAATASVDGKAFEQVLMAVVADKTGYPVEMLELDMDMEADLGIDSIKRVEILGAAQDAMPGLPEVSPETLAELRTLKEIIEVFAANTGESSVKKPKTVAPAPSATVAIKRLSAPLLEDASLANSHCLLVSDGTALTAHLAEKLIAQDVKVSVVEAAWVKKTGRKALPQAAAVHAIDAATEENLGELLKASGTVDHVLMLAAPAKIKGFEFSADSKQSLDLAFLLAKLSGVKNSNAARKSFVAVTRQGGQFGLDSSDADLVQGAFSGLVKTLSHEWPEVFCRTIDIVEKPKAADVAESIVSELLDSQTNIKEVGYDQEGRLTLVAEKTDSFALTAGNSIDENSVFLVSGGAKGVTAHCVIRLAEVHKSRFILLGRSQFSEQDPSWAQGIEDEQALKKAAMQALIAQGDKPTPVKVQQLISPVLGNREIAGTLQAIRSVGGQAEYLAIDVTDEKALKTEVSRLSEKLGTVTGIIHGAGVLADKFIEQKTLAELDRVYRTKIDGLSAMFAAVDMNNIKHLVMFSSAAGFYGNAAQSDYAMANEILNKSAWRFKNLNPQAQAVSFNWGPWDGGMVTPELKRMFEARGAYIIPLDSGAELLLNELSADSNRCPQIIVGDDLSGAEQAANAKK